MAFNSATATSQATATTTSTVKPVATPPPRAARPTTDNTERLIRLSGYPAPRQPANDRLRDDDRQRATAWPSHSRLVMKQSRRLAPAQRALDGARILSHTVDDVRRGGR